MIKYDWEKIIPVCQELIGQSGNADQLAAAVSARIGMVVPSASLTSGMKSVLGLDSRKFSDIRAALITDGQSKLSPLAQALLSILRKERDRPFTTLELCNLCDRSPDSVLGAVKELRDSGFYVQATEDSHIMLPRDIAPTIDRIPVELWTRPSQIHRYGAVSDTHLANRKARLDTLEAIYDIFENEGIEIVLHTGNLVDGEFRFNRHELLAHGVEGQIAFCAKHYPQRDGMVTKFISADDHEGWWAKDIGLDIGRHMENGFREYGRNDLIWIGHVERDLSLYDDNPQATLRLMHPGGGTAYAISYKPQKIVEGFQPGEKPSFLLLGHYHKYGVFYPREVYTLMAGTCCDQTMFMRKKPLGADVGGSIIEIRMTPMGGVGRVRHDWFPFYNQEYYKQWDYASMFNFMFEEK